ncbi:MAG: hypothetical protein MJ252_27855 [archaeon]|nr:hypothetical protein [archaeon]
MESKNFSEDNIKNCICNISCLPFKGLGFFAKVFINNMFLKALVSNEKVIKQTLINSCSEINIESNLKNFTLILDKSKRRIFSIPSKNGDITIVELLDTDSVNCFLEMDLDYLKDSEGESLRGKCYLNEDILIFDRLSFQQRKLSSLESNDFSFDFERIENITNGGPILRKSTGKVIGLTKTKEKGILIPNILDELSLSILFNLNRKQLVPKIEDVIISYTAYEINGRFEVAAIYRERRSDIQLYNLIIMDVEKNQIIKKIEESDQQQIDLVKHYFNKFNKTHYLIISSQRESILKVFDINDNYRRISSFTCYLAPMMVYPLNMIFNGDDYDIIVSGLNMDNTLLSVYSKEGKEKKSIELDTKIYGLSEVYYVDNKTFILCACDKKIIAYNYSDSITKNSYETNGICYGTPVISNIKGIQKVIGLIDINSEFFLCFWNFNSGELLNKISLNLSGNPWTEKYVHPHNKKGTGTHLDISKFKYFTSLFSVVGEKFIIVVEKGKLNAYNIENYSLVNDIRINISAPMCDISSFNVIHSDTNGSYLFAGAFEVGMFAYKI